MKYILDHIDWLSVKGSLASITLAMITGEMIFKALSALAALSTIAYNYYRFRKDKK